MSERRATGDTVILPFAVGMLIGGTVTGILCIVMGQGKRLLGLGELVTGHLNLSKEWLFTLTFSVLFGSLLELGVLKLIWVIVRFPFALRLSSATLVVLGIAVASVSTIASCLTIDLGSHPEIPFYKGPEPPFSYFILTIFAVAPFLLVKRATSPTDDCERDEGAEESEQTPDKDAR
jgi:hypothetical protein